MEATNQNYHLPGRVRVIFCSFSGSRFSVAVFAFVPIFGSPLPSSDCHSFFFLRCLLLVVCHPCHTLTLTLTPSQDSVSVPSSLQGSECRLLGSRSHRLLGLQGNMTRVLAVCGMDLTSQPDDTTSFPKLLAREICAPRRTDAHPRGTRYAHAQATRNS